ncbi:hypothetical protein VaNZ11_001777 [Volvox africanus]|uniref:Uncharacterized protein n=1 Tax=Volvox africanus TaxID=51714 RepID=A0ABQ5RQJ5_9CHLO|nr:hypothetical protein VaNZ11_001777 [Volvox africanus]
MQVVIRRNLLPIAILALAVFCPIAWYFCLPHSAGSCTECPPQAPQGNFPNRMMACCGSTTTPRALCATFRLAPHISPTPSTSTHTRTRCAVLGSNGGKAAWSGVRGAVAMTTTATTTTTTIAAAPGTCRLQSRPCVSSRVGWALLHAANPQQQSPPKPFHSSQPHSQAPLSRRSVLRAGVLAPLGWAECRALHEAPARGGPLSRVAAAAAMSTSTASADAAASPSGAIVVYVTVPNAQVGEDLGAKLVETKLAACVNILPGLTSIYTWKGKVEKDSELLLIIKSRHELLTELTAFVRANHPYDEPEVIALPILGGSPSYLQWLMDNTRGAGAGADTATDTV